MSRGDWLALVTIISVYAAANAAWLLSRMRRLEERIEDLESQADRLPLRRRRRRF